MAPFRTPPTLGALGALGARGRLVSQGRGVYCAMLTHFLSDQFGPPMAMLMFSGPFRRAADIGEPLDTDRELITVGWSNVMSGSTGGFTGR